MTKNNLILSVVVFIAISLSTSGYAQAVTIGTQIWSGKNLDVTTFRNGDSIPEAKTPAQWEKAGNNKQPAWCYYQNKPENGTKFGKLYNLFAVVDQRGLAPSGWHVPSKEEWCLFEDYVRNKPDLLLENNLSGNFGGTRDYRGNFNSINYNAGWWSATSSPPDWSYYWGNGHIEYSGGAFSCENIMRKASGLFVRCIKN